MRGERLLFSQLSFKVAPGTGLLIQGANGAGKTSLLRLLLGLATPTHGQVAWGGQPIRALGQDYRRHFIYCGHSNALKEDLSALENVRAAAALADRPVAREAALAALARAGVDTAAELPVRNLSQGQKRRTALARLALDRAKLWVLDEPLAALDARGGEWLATMLDAHLAGGGLAVVTGHQSMPTRTRLATLRIGA
jgi:heme exporter protein A